jgi:2-iminobutanoate/2-iminopropanoate deaminase
MTMATPTLISEGAPEPRGPYPHARIEGGWVWVTGQIGRDPSTGGFVAGGFEAEFHQAITNLETILREVGSSLDLVVKTGVQFVDEDDLDAMNRICAERFLEPYPSRTSFGVAFLWKGARVQIDAVARLPIPALGDPGSTLP